MRPIQITSRDNPWMKRFRRAVDEHDQEIVLEGVKQVRDAIAHGWKPIAVAADRAVPNDVIGDAQLLEVDSKLLKQIEGTVHSQGVLALFERPQEKLESLRFPEKATVVVLDQVQDPGNVGTIIRLAAAFDAAAVLLTDQCADPFGPKAIRASVGAVLSVTLARAPVVSVLDRLRQERFALFAADAAGDPLPSPPPARTALVFGSEGQGVREVVRSAAKLVAIPMSDRVESLNVAAAAAILLSRIYESR